MNIPSFAPEQIQKPIDGRTRRIAASAQLAAFRSNCSRRCTRLVRSEEGSPLIEFAFVLPLMMLCLTGMFAFGVAIYNAINLTQAVGQGGLRLQQIRSTTADPCADTLTAIENAAPTLRPASITLTLTINGGSPVTGSSCSGSTSALQGAQNKPVTVNATYPCTLALYGVNLGSCQLTAQVTNYEY